MDGCAQLTTHYDMADQYEDLLRYVEQYTESAIAYFTNEIGTDRPPEATSSEQNACSNRTETRSPKKDGSTCEQGVANEEQEQSQAKGKQEGKDSNELSSQVNDGYNQGNEGSSYGGNSQTHTSGKGERLRLVGDTEGNLTEKEVMEIFEERERRFNEEVLSPRCLSPANEKSGWQHATQKVRSRSRSPCSPYGLGLEHLDHLVRLLEQLNELKEQNRSLKKKCQYLENTKSLLQVHNVMIKSHISKSSSPKVRGRSKSTKHSTRSKILQHQHVSDGGLLGHYASDTSEDEDRCDQQARSKPAKLTQRSQSVGSINVDMVDLDLTLGSDHPTHHQHQHTKHLVKRADKHGKDSGRFEAMFSRSKISSKWERVKKVFSGKPEAPSKSEHATITAEQLVRANSKYSSKGPTSLPQPIPTGSLSESGDQHHMRASTSPTSPTHEPSSPASVESEPLIPSVIADDQDFYGELVGPEVLDASTEMDVGGSGSGGGGVGAGHSPAATSDESCQPELRLLPPPPTSPQRETKSSSPSTAETGPEKVRSKSHFLTVKQTSLRRRQSSPTLCMSDDSDMASSSTHGDSLELPRSPSIRRSSSFKVTKSTENFADISDDSSTKGPTSGGGGGPTATSSSSKGAAEGRKGHGHRSAWGRVKDIIHTRKDSLKRKNKRSNSAGDMLPDAATVDGLYDYCSKSDVEELAYDRELDDFSPRSASPRLTRKSSSRGHPTPSPRASPPRQRRPESPPSPQLQPPLSPQTATHAAHPPVTRPKKPDSLKSPSGSPPPAPWPGKESSGPSTSQGSTSPSPLDVTALMGGMSEEFNKKLQEWEEKKQFRRSLIKESSINLEDETKDGSDAARFTEEFIRKMEEWERMKGLGSPPKSRPSQTQSPDVCTPPEQGAAPPSMEELQKHLSESFSKTVQEWERIKTQRIKETGSPVPDLTNKLCDKRSRKQERSKSRERDRSRSKYDKQRERELHKIEKKEQKIEKEKLKLEKMRQKLEGIETMTEVYGEGVSQEFARKLYEWEVMKGLRQEHSTSAVSEDTEGNKDAAKTPEKDTISPTVHTRSQSAKAYKEYFAEKRERTQSESKVDDLGTGNASLAERRKSEVGNARSASVPSIRASSRQLVDDSTSIDLNLTSQDSQSAEERLRHLVDELTNKEEELSAMHYEVQQLTERISAMDIEHHKQIEAPFEWIASKCGMALPKKSVKYLIWLARAIIADTIEIVVQIERAENYKRELWASSRVGRYTIEIDLVQASINELRLKVDQLTAYQGKLINERNHLQYQLEAELRTRQEVEARLIQQVRAFPTKPSQHQQAIESVKDFDKLCEFFLKLWSQLNELRLGILERNKLLAAMQQHVLQQEVGNRLLAADMASRDLQLAYFQGARRRRVLKRSHTFAGRDHMTRGNGDSKVWTKQHQSTNYHSIFRRAIDQLRHGDIEGTSVDWEWLERLRAQRASAIGQLQCAAAMATHEAQTERLEYEHTVSDSSVQTIMSLCNHTSTLPAPPSPPHQVPPIVLENKSIQADAQEDLISTSAAPVATSTPVKASTCMASSGIEVLPSRPQLVRQKRAQSPLSPAKTASSDSVTTSFDKNTAASVFTFNSGDNMAASAVSVRRGSRAEDSTSDAADMPLLRHPGPWVQRSGVSDESDAGGDSESLPTTLYPPPSPIIRSRNTRKLKADVKSTQLYSDGRTWKATPPKRVRHRRTSTDKRPDSTGTEDIEDVETPKTGTLPSQTRGRTERFSIPQPRSLSVPPRDSIMYELCFRDRHISSSYSPREPTSTNVSDMIIKFENGPTGSQISSCRGNRSPSPAIRKPQVSPVHRLKTAAELMESGSGPRRPWRSASQTRASSVSPVPPGSSDKENERRDSRVKQIVQRLSRESTPDRTSSVKGAVGGRPLSPTGELIRQTVRRLSESSCDVKPALMDLTNGSRSTNMSSTFPDRNWPSEGVKVKRISPSRSAPSSSKKRHELPRQGQVSRFTSMYESKVEDREVIIEAKPRKTSVSSPTLAEISKSPLCDSIKSIDSEEKTENEIVVKPEGPRPRTVSQSSTLDRRQVKMTQPSPSSSLGGSARDLKSKFFGRKAPKSPRSSSGGAISALVKQTLSVEVQGTEDASAGKAESKDSGEQTKSPTEKSGRARRFLDTTWLQKPRRFFKVSKC